ncbi:hypothetical protein OIE66_28595 [Nonomuraea sp. NBC_01738]|uniref:hypothetical protein n=1 Tax=Nonomuraea sp. NBC_01738 TaxID=2976003 RepID=UPI002E168821|nr:hypothetical protein OIE66_28595 [Nonomuraea sp. NBC_01738]
MRPALKIALTAASVSGLLLTATPAMAAPAGNAPSCVTVWENIGTITKTGYARNDCGSTLNLKIVWAHGVDGSCSSVRPGQTLSSKVSRGPRTFDGANTC